MAFRGTSKATYPTASDSDGWVRVGAPKKAPHTTSRHPVNSGAGRASGPSHEDAKLNRARASTEQDTKQRLYAVHNQLKKLLQTSGGNLSIFEPKVVSYYQTLTKPDEKAKVISILVENSLHELFAPGTFFGNIIASDMSISSTMSGLKERDGYNLFTWAIWIQWNKDPVPGLVRTEEDIISTVAALMAHRVNPFRINQKHETFFDTAELCVSKKKFSSETYNAIYQMVLYNPTDIDMYIACLKHYFPDILCGEMKFSLGLLQWGLLASDEIRDALIAEAFEMDKYRVGCEKLIFHSTDFQYVTAFDAMLKLIHMSPHKNFEQYFKDHPIDIDGLTSKIASYYMTNILKEHRTAYQLIDIPKEDGWCFKNLENLGAFIWDVSQYIELPRKIINEFATKIKIGFGVRGLKKAGTNSDLLREILGGSISNVERSFVSRAMEAIPVKEVVPVEDDTPKVLKRFKTGLETLAPEEVVTYSTVPSVYHTPGCIHDSICDIADMNKTNDPEIIARSFVIAAGALYKSHQTSKLSAHISFLFGNNLLNKDAVEKALDENSDYILDLNDYSKSSQDVLKILRASLK